jgi:uncharacterized protein YegP (UPF0339 family)
VALLALAACGAQNKTANDLAKTMQQGLSDSGAEGNTTTIDQETKPAAAPVTAPVTAPSNAPSTPPAAPQNLNEIVVSEDIPLKDFPVVKTHALQEGVRYRVELKTDKPIQFVLYNEAHYNAWKQSGEHGIAKINSNSPAGCCTADGSWPIDINKGEGGNYYFVFDASKIADTSALPTTGKLVVTKVSTI